MIHLGTLVCLLLILIDFSDDKNNTLKKIGTTDHKKKINSDSIQLHSVYYVLATVQNSLHKY